MSHLISIIFSCDQKLYRLLGQSVRPQKFPTLGRRNLAKRGWAMGVAYCKKAHNFQMDLQICTRFRGKAVHEQKDS